MFAKGNMVVYDKLNYNLDTVRGTITYLLTEEASVRVKTDEYDLKDVKS